MRFTRTSIAVVVIGAALLLQGPAGAQSQPSQTIEQRMKQARRAALENKLLRVTLVHADAAIPVSAPDLLSAVAIVTGEALSMAGVLPSTLGVGKHHVTARDDDQVFGVVLVERSPQQSLVELQGDFDPGQRERVVEALGSAVAQQKQMTPDERRATLEKLRKQRQADRAKQSILATLVRGQAEARKEGLNARLARLDAERERLEMDLTAAKARKDALRRQMEELRAEAEDRARNDPIRDQLKRVLEMRMQELKRVKDMAASGQASLQEVAQVEARVAEAEVQLLSRREDALRGGEDKGDLLGRLANELAMLSIEEAEREARLSYINKRLPELNPRALDEKALEGIVQQYPTLLSEAGELPPLYFELDKRVADSLKTELGLVVSEVLVEVEPATAPAP